MIRSMRKYNRWFLVIGGSLLMVAFLLQGALNNRVSDGGSHTVLKVNGDKISGREMLMAQRELRALEFIAPYAVMNLQIADGVQWLLMSREASNEGLVGGSESGLDMALLLMQQNSTEPISPENVDLVLDRIGSMNEIRFTREQLLDVLAKLRGVARLNQVAGGGSSRAGARVSIQRTIAMSRERLDAASVDYVFIPPSRELAGIAEPDEAAIQAQYDRFKDALRDTGDFGMGYTNPPRVRLEWLQLDAAAISSAITPDEVEVEKRLLKANPNPEQITDEAREVMRDTIRSETVSKVMTEAELALRTAIRAATQKLPTDGPFRVTPADWSAGMPRMDALADAVVTGVHDRTGHAIPRPKVVVTSDWVESGSAPSLEGIGPSKLNATSGSLPFSTILFRAKELTDSREFSLQVGIPFAERLEDESGNWYYFTILEARKQQPASLDEVRSTVITDKKKLDAYEILKGKIQDFSTRARQDGLASLARADGADFDDAPVNENVRVTRTFLQKTDVAANIEAFRNVVVDAAAKLDPKAAVADQPIENRVVVQQSDRGQGILVAVITGLFPVTIETFSTNSNFAASGVQQMEQTKVVGEDGVGGAFALSRLESRLKVTYPNRDKE